MGGEPLHTVITQSLLKHLSKSQETAVSPCKAQSVSLASVMLLKEWAYLSPWGEESSEAPTLPTRRVHVGQLVLRRLPSSCGAWRGGPVLTLWVSPC